MSGLIDPDFSGLGRSFASMTVLGTTIVATIAEFGPAITSNRTPSTTETGCCYFSRRTRIVRVPRNPKGGFEWWVRGTDSRHHVDNRIRLEGWDDRQVADLAETFGVNKRGQSETKVLVGSPAWASMLEIIATDPGEVYAWSHNDAIFPTWWERAFEEARERYPWMSPGNYFRCIYGGKNSHLSQAERHKRDRPRDLLTSMEARRHSYECAQELSFALKRSRIPYH